MLKELLQYFKEHNRPETVEANGHIYSTRNLERLDKESSVDSIKVRSLTGLLDYIKSDFDTDRKFMIHVEGPQQVYLYDALNDDGDRRCYVKAHALLPDINFNSYMDIERFIIQTQANFIQNDHTASLLRFVGSISEQDSKETKDNGITQSVVAKTGVATVEEVNVPNPVLLRPFRTFVEVPQPESSFILRLRNGPAAALYQADGGAWELNAMHNIEKYLSESLSDEITEGKVFIVS
ncbi:hypothetical protein FQ085_11745 [Planococcus sp. ANT_H30]|uniref:hypothetical protein n=1 Tax=Planococcus sp. ANT_H30 TaxID=2597347 RepID=UPI0011EBB087|nr:hypothetical protein [Planococcus sp. ANT_H30]KAA0956658.1 hypothetical protein FQ085_11745 [Planococcus sp. ANT_H30]